jgi:hypothetical protein
MKHKKYIILGTFCYFDYLYKNSVIKEGFLLVSINVAVGRFKHERCYDTKEMNTYKRVRNVFSQTAFAK